MIARAVTAVLAVLAATACGGSDPAIVVELRGRPALAAVDQVEVTVANAGATQTKTFATGGRAFPLTFSITTSGRTGAIDVGVRALAGDAVVGVGALAVDAAASDAVLVVEPADFVVNTELAGTQAPSFFPISDGYQLAAGGGVVTAGFADDCPVGVCNQYGRRFTVDGVAQSTSLAAGTGQFRWNDIDSSASAQVAVASAADGRTIAVWNSPTGVACRAIGDDGQAGGFETEIATDTNPEAVSAAAYTDASFRVVWQADDAASGKKAIRSAVVDAECALKLPPFIAAGSLVDASGPAITASSIGTLVTWLDNGNVRFRLGAVSGAFSPVGTSQTGTVLVAAPAPRTVDYAHVVPVDDGFAIAYALTSADFTADEVRVRTVDPVGAPRAPDTVVATGAEWAAPSVARRDKDGALAVVWVDCQVGDGADCGVFGQVLRPSGLPVGGPFLVNTTTAGRQDRPSIAATDDGFVVSFGDESLAPPDTDQGGVRARFIYPAYDDARGVSGARCTSTAQCGAELACGPDSTSDMLCAPTCTGTGPCAGGGTCTANGSGESYCKF